MHDVLPFWTESRAVDGPAGPRRVIAMTIVQDPRLRDHAKASRRHDEELGVDPPAARGSPALIDDIDAA